MQAQSGDAPRSFDRPRPADAGDPADGAGRNFSRAAVATACGPEPRPYNRRRLPGQTTNSSGFDKRWPACRLPSDKISPPKAARPDQNRPPPAVRCDLGIRAARGRRVRRRPRPVGGNRPRPTARRSQKTITCVVLERVGGTTRAELTVGPRCATGVDFRCQLTEVDTGPARCSIAAHRIRAAMAACPLVYSIGTASSVSAIAPHPDAAPSLLVTPDTQPGTPAMTCAVAYELRVEGRGIRRLGRP